MNDMDGIAGERLSYDDQGNLVSGEFVDSAGAPTESNETKAYRWVVKYNDRGNIVEGYQQMKWYRSAGRIRRTSSA
jgi:hypothetical protein